MSEKTAKVTAKAPFPWFGGKAAPKIHNAIMEALPPHEYYVEPFGGGASILLGKEPVKVEVYNDINRGVVNFFRVVASPEDFPRFYRCVAQLPYSRELYEEYLRTWPAIHDQVEQAIRWYYVARSSFSGLFGSSWGYALHSNHTHAWNSAILNLPAVHYRMKSVMIECADWRDVLSRFNGPGYLAYCDPPYVPGTRKAGGYAHELTVKDHHDLVDTLLHYDGAVVLSGYNSEVYRPLLDAGWDYLAIDVVCSAAGRTRASGLQGEGNCKKYQRRTEGIWRNPEAMRRIASAAR